MGLSLKFTKIHTIFSMYYHIEQIVQRSKFSWFSWFLLERRMFFRIFKSVLALVDIVLMQMQKNFCEYSHGGLITKVLSFKVLYDTVSKAYIALCNFCSYG